MLVDKKRYALVGTGFRGMTMFARPIVRDYAAQAELVGVFDTNPKRMDCALEWLRGNVPGFTRDVPKFSDFDKMLSDSKCDCVIVASRDCTHADYVVRALRAGKRVYVEKPLCTTAAQCRAILAAQKETGGVCLTTHNMRYDAACQSIRSIMMQERTGKVRHIQFDETLDRTHGADYFRRWHRNKADSGGLQIHKASHHFDAINWWIGSRPAHVSAQGSLKFYGRCNSYRGPRCSACPHAPSCPMHVDYAKIDIYKKLYFDAESADGYFRDGCVFDPSIDIEDQIHAHIRYENGVEADYSLTAYVPYESLRVAVDGTMGRLEYQSAYSARNIAALAEQSAESMRLLMPGYDIMDVPINRNQGDHGGADPMLLKDFLTRDWGLDPLPEMASVQQAAQAVLIGSAINKSLATGQGVDVQELLEHD